MSDSESNMKYCITAGCSNKISLEGINVGEKYCSVCFLRMIPRRDNVNHPKHYTSHPSGVECITVTEHMNFNVGNAVKYLWHCDHKNGLEDLKKLLGISGEKLNCGRNKMCECPITKRIAEYKKSVKYFVEVSHFGLIQIPAELYEIYFTTWEFPQRLKLHFID